MLPPNDLPFPLHIQLEDGQQNWATPASEVSFHSHDNELKDRHRHLNLGPIHYPCPLNMQFLPTPHRRLFLQISNNYYPTLGTLFRWRSRSCPTISLPQQTKDLATACPFCLLHCHTSTEESLSHIIKCPHYASITQAHLSWLCLKIGNATPVAHHTQLFQLLKAPNTLATLGQGLFPKDLHSFLLSHSTLLDSYCKTILMESLNFTHQLIFHRSRTLDSCLQVLYNQHPQLEELHLWLRGIVSSTPEGTSTTLISSSSTELVPNCQPTIMEDGNIIHSLSEDMDIEFTTLSILPGRDADIRDAEPVIDIFSDSEDDSISDS